MLAVLGTTDITKHIQAESYDIDAVELFNTWQDGNYRFHKQLMRSQISGSFNVICCKNTIETDEFLKLLEDNTTDDILTILLWVNNKEKMEAVQCYYKIETANHTDEANIFSISVEEC